MVPHIEVSALMRQVAACVILPRYRALADDEIVEKSPGELVTIADREAEEWLRHGLSQLDLGAHIIGEEAVSADPGLLDGVSDGLVFLIDPLDGTGNFVAGRVPFGMMVALIDNGELLAGWMLDPLSMRLCYAERDKGAWCNGRRVQAWANAGRIARPVAALGAHFMPAAQRCRVHAHASQFMEVHPVPRCAAESYPRLAMGGDDIALFQRILPWDHAAGALFLREAGGVVTHWDGQPYRIGGEGRGILAAATPALWEVAAAALLTDESGLLSMEAGTC